MRKYKKEKHNTCSMAGMMLVQQIETSNPYLIVLRSTDGV